MSNLRTCKPINEMRGPLLSITPEVSIFITCATKKKLNQLTDYKLAYL